jgi:antagonist of KipI
MIEILNPGWQSLIVDSGRYGYGHIGVPPSSALDRFAYDALNFLLGNNRSAPALEVLGRGFALTFGKDLQCAITGARVAATLNDQPRPGWTPFQVNPGDVLRIKDVHEGFRYYIGFSGALILEQVIKSFSTNLDCRFGGYQGRSLLKGDRIDIEPNRAVGEHFLPAGLIPAMNPPHHLRIIEGAEKDFFSHESINKFFEKNGSGYKISSQSNRNGIRLEGEPLKFREGVDKSIISEAILPGTLQIPGDGLPIIALYERTIGGYARLGTVAKVDQDRLAHLRPGDPVFFERITLDEAESQWIGKMKSNSFLNKQ